MSSSPNQGVSCQNKSIEAFRRVELSVQPKYFFKPVWNGEWVGLVGHVRDTASPSGRDQNLLIHLSSGRQIEIPGALDPMGLMGYPLLAVPLDTSDGSLKMSFYDVRELLKKQKASVPIWQRQGRHSGRYQSLGLLRVTPSGRVQFRMLTDGSEGGDYQDFEADFTQEPARVKPLSQVRELCVNLRRQRRPLNLKLPMISKEGRRVSGFDVQDQKMKVFDLRDDGTCRLVSDAFLSEGDVGKLDFAPGGNAWAFHFSDRSLESEPSTFGAPRATWQLRSAIFDSVRKVFQVLPFSGRGSNSYFPAFLPNGHVLVLESIQEKSFFVEYDLKSLPSIKESVLKKYIMMSKDDFLPAQQVTDQMMKECFQEQNVSLRSNRLISLLGLSVSQCYSLANGAKIQNARAWCERFFEIEPSPSQP